MTHTERITDLKALLAEAKEALMNRDPKTREKECYDSGHTPCRCTLCKINTALKDTTPVDDCDCCQELEDLKEELNQRGMDIDIIS